MLISGLSQRLAARARVVMRGGVPAVLLEDVLVMDPEDVFSVDWREPAQVVRIIQLFYQDIRLATQRLDKNFTTWPCLWC